MFTPHYYTTQGRTFVFPSAFKADGVIFMNKGAIDATFVQNEQFIFVLLYYYKKCYFKIDKVTHKQGLDLINHFIWNPNKRNFSINKPAGNIL